MMDYAQTGAEPDFEGALDMAFSFIRVQIDRDNEKYQAKCDKHQQNGTKGGRPIVKQENNRTVFPETQNNRTVISETERLFQKPKKANENENETEKPNEKEKKEKDVLPLREELSSPIGEDASAARACDDIKSDPVPYKKIMQLYNETCVNLPSIQFIDGKRRMAVAARFKTHDGDISKFEELFTKAADSKFLNGDNGNNWRADFDWLVRPTNMAKVLEDKYHNDRAAPTIRGHPGNERGRNVGHAVDRGYDHQSPADNRDPWGID
jgi:hypothetical protein